MRGKTVACEAKTADRYGRTVVLCLANGEDLGAAMVDAGMAWALTRYSMAYLHLDWWAWWKPRGVHAHGCQVAWEWGAGNRGAR
jgi:endonuclease YncB( thermonuclease family)